MEKRVDMKKEYGMAGVAILCWGCVATVSKLLMNQMDAMYVLAVSFLAATIFLGIYNARKGYFQKFRKMNASVCVKMILIGSLGVFLYNFFLLLGTARLPAQEAFVINDLWPALIILFSCIFLHERLTFGKVAAITFSFIGIVVVTTNGDVSSLASADGKGIIYCLIAAVCYGLYSTLNKTQDYDKNCSVFLSYAVGTVVALVCCLVMGTFRLPTGTETIGLVINGTVCNALPYLLWALALDHGNTAIIANLAYLTPFISLILTHVVLHEPVTVYSVLGLLLILLGIGIQILTQTKVPGQRATASGCKED